MLPLSFTGKRWTVPSLMTSSDPRATLAAIAASRELGEESFAWEDPATYPMALAAAERLQKAVRDRETIGIIGDYDCDGLTSTTILVRLLRRLGVEPIVRLPHRLKEGYGAQALHVEELHAAGVTLLFTVDTGIVATNALARAAERGIDVLILDHHAYAELPPAFAILHPTLTTLRSAPAAAGVALAFAHAVLGHRWEDHDTDLALATVGTIADVVSLTHENRTMVRAGLHALARLDPASGLGALRDRSGAGAHPTATDVAFRMAPRLNAAGRLDDASVGLQALLGDLACVDELERLNTERQRLTRACMDEVAGLVDASSLPACICVASPHFQKGVVGLIAGKLAEQYGRPALAAAIDGDTCTASLRGIPGHDIAAALRAHATLFTAFGGHAQAGGCSFRLENLPAIREALHADVLTYVREDALRPTLAPDAVAHPAHLTMHFVDTLATLEPFGQENREPLFLVPSVTLQNVRRIGSDGQHLQARIGQAGIIGFGLGHLEERLQEAVDLVCRATANVWNGTRKAQLSVVDIRSAQAVQTGANFPSISNTAMTGTFNAEAIL